MRSHARYAQMLTLGIAMILGQYTLLLGDTDEQQTSPTVVWSVIEAAFGGEDYSKADAWEEVNTPEYPLYSHYRTWLDGDEMVPEGIARVRFEETYSEAVSHLMTTASHVPSALEAAADGLDTARQLYDAAAIMEEGQRACSKLLGIAATHGTAALYQAADWTVATRALTRMLVAHEMKNVSSKLRSTAMLVRAAQGRQLSYEEANRLYHSYVDAQTRARHIFTLGEKTFPNTDLWSQVKRVLLSAAGAGAGEVFKQAAEAIEHAPSTVDIEKAVRIGVAAGAVLTVSDVKALAEAVLGVQPLADYYRDTQNRHALIPLHEVAWEAWLADVNVAPRAMPAGTRGFLKDGKAYVPLRAIAEWMGVKVDYVTSLRMARLAKGAERMFVLTSGDRTTEVIWPPHRAEGILKDGRTYVPVRYVAEYLGAEVEWKADTAEVRIRTGSRQIVVPTQEPPGKLLAPKPKQVLSVFLKQNGPEENVGDVCIRYDNGTTKQLTYSRMCADPKLSHNKRFAGWKVVESMDYHGDRVLVSDCVAIYDASRGRKLRTIPTDGFVRNFAFFPSSENSTVVIYVGGMHFAGHYVEYDIDSGRSTGRKWSDEEGGPPGWPW